MDIRPFPVSLSVSIPWPFSFPGFVRLRMLSKDGPPIAFVEFADVRLASYALNTLQGIPLLSSDKGMRIEFAKTKMAPDNPGMFCIHPMTPSISSLFA